MEGGRKVMNTYNVQVRLNQESSFDVEIEAESEDEAQDLVTDQVWNDDLHREIRNSNEIISEDYYVEEMLYDFDIYDAEDEFLDVMYEQPNEAVALEEYNADCVVSGSHAERR
tara:strand:+ start:2820 stop:3158 length:339 start_codon:yes stop_codon:yes gene_type:complete